MAWHRITIACALVGSFASLATTRVHAQSSAPVSARTAERAELESLRSTTIGLIEALVEQGLINRARADVLLREVARRAPVEPVATTTTAGASVTDAVRPAAANVVRVPYIPESLKTQLKEEIRTEVMASAKSEGWTEGRKLPGWLDGVSIEGDVRVRLESDRFGKDNIPASVYRAQVDSPAWSPDLTNTQVDRNRMTLRARLGVGVKVSEQVNAGVRIATGGVSNPASESQTLGTDFNRHAVGLDRAFVRWAPLTALRFEAGRMAVPFYGSDLLWPDDLSIDGVAVHGEQPFGYGVTAFANLGAFPLEEFALSGADKWLFGAQVGANWALGTGTMFRVGVGMYDFRRIEGVRESGIPPSSSLSATTPYQLSQYPASIRQKGNTLINLNDPTSTSSPVWGLASKFRPVDLTTAVSFTQLAPVKIDVMVDYVKNSAFDIADIRARAGTSAVSDLAQKNTGLQLRAQVGTPNLASKGDWQVFAALRKFERDAWPDAFTDTTWNLGGTNYKGYSLGGAYYFDRSTSFAMRWTSTRNLDDGQRFQAIPGDPTSISGNLSSAPLKIEVLQFDLNVRF